MTLDSIDRSGDIITIHLIGCQLISHIVTRDPMRATSKMGVEYFITFGGESLQNPLVQTDRFLSWVDFSTCSVVIFEQWSRFGI